MKIAFTTKGAEWTSKMDARFGRTEYFVVYDEETSELKTVDNKDVANEAHGAGPKAVQILSELKADVLITGNGPGEKAGMAMQHTGIECYVGAGDMTMKEAYDAFKAGSLQKF